MLTVSIVGFLDGSGDWVGPYDTGERTTLEEPVPVEVEDLQNKPITELSIRQALEWGKRNDIQLLFEIKL